MTEEEWLAATSPEPLLDFLGKGAGERKFTLFACACCRRVWHLLLFEESTNVVEVYEREADGAATQEEVSGAGAEAHDTLLMIVSAIEYNPPMEEVLEAIHEAGLNSQAVLQAAEASCAFSESGPRRDWMAASAARDTVAARSYSGLPELSEPDEDAARAEELAQAALVREVFGNPFRKVEVKPAWRTPDVLNLAQAAYEARRLPSGELEEQRLAVLADALEEAGCAERLILEHLRNPGPHVRGCWAVDAILDRG